MYSNLNSTGYHTLEINGRHEFRLKVLWHMNVFVLRCPAILVQVVDAANTLLVAVFQCMMEGDHYSVQQDCGSLRYNHLARKNNDFVYIIVKSILFIVIIYGNNTRYNIIRHKHYFHCVHDLQLRHVELRNNFGNVSLITNFRATQQTAFMLDGFVEIVFAISGNPMLLNYRHIPIDCDTLRIVSRKKLI